MSLSTQPYKGARDFYPEQKRIQKYMFGVLRKTVETFGYEEYDAPILEPTELFASKTSDEIVNEQTYSFVDRGDRNVTIRPEMTPTVSRMVAAKRHELAYPLRWYSIPNVWRYERPQRGRLREHWQLNVDLFGVESLEADQEAVMVADAIMRAFGAKRDMYTIKLNSRQLVNAFLREVLDLDEAQVPILIRLMDRINKIDHAEFVGLADAVFTPHQREAGANDALFAFLKAGSIAELPAEIRDHSSAKELDRLQQFLEKSKITNTVFDAGLMRGFDYYTDIVFEVFDTNPENSRSLFGGGRYDGLVELFGVEAVASVGFGLGDVTLQNFLETHELLPELRTETDAYVVLIGDVYEAAQPHLRTLREAGVRLALDITGRKPDKQTRTADKKAVPYVLFIGEQELESEQFVLKNLKTGEEEKHAMERLVSIIKDHRKR